MPNIIEQRLGSIRPRLEALAHLAPDFWLGGAESHSYQLEPPLSLDEVRAFELRHKITLPEDYRRFLLEVGSHGAGPYYGLNRLGDKQHLNKTSPVLDLATAFVLREFLDLSNSETLAEAEIYGNQWISGTLCLSHQGCGMYDLLVVTGEEFGHVWTDDRINDFGIFPVAPNHAQFGETQEDAQIFTVAETERLSFLDWYEWWLDWSEEEVEGLEEA